MIDIDIVMKRLEDLQREVSRIEFSANTKPQTVEAAIKARLAVEGLIRVLSMENDE